MTENASFRVCSICRKPIPFESRYYACSVSTCNRKPTALYFCSVPCWDAHVPDARHKDAWAIEEKAPTEAEARAEKNATNDSVRRRVVSSSTSNADATRGADGARSTNNANNAVNAADDDAPGHLPEDILVVVSKLKAYVKARGSMNTSDGVTDVLSEHLRSLCTKAIRSAAQNSRKTVLARDFEAVLRGTVASE